MTPADVPFGQAASVPEHRQRIVAAGSPAHSDRFVKAQSQPVDLTQGVSINPPLQKTTAPDSRKTELITSDDLWVDPIRGDNDHSSVRMIDCGAYPIYSSLVSQWL
jgi:hypothetical protein